MQDIGTTTYYPSEQALVPSVSSIYPTDIGQLSSKITEFIKTHPDAVVYLEGVEYLVTQNNFKYFLNFIQHLGDLIPANKSRFIVSLDPLAFEQKERHLLQREINNFGKLYEEEKVNRSSEEVKEYISEGKNVLAIMRDFLAAKDLYRAMSENQGASKILFLTTNQSLENIL